MARSTWRTARQKGRFSEDDLTPLSLFANQAAIAIENAQLNEELEARISERTHELESAKTSIEKNWHEAVEANRLGTVWLGNVAHDMRAPLTIVLSSLELLKDGAFGEVNARQIEWIRRAYDAAGRAIKFTNDVFDLSKLELGGLRLYPEHTALRRSCRMHTIPVAGCPGRRASNLRISLSVKTRTL